MGRQQKIKRERKQMRERSRLKKSVLAPDFRDTELSKFFPTHLKQFSEEIATYAINETRPGIVMVEFGEDEVYQSFESLEQFYDDIQDLEESDYGSDTSRWMESVQRHLRLIEETNFSTHRLLWLGIAEPDEKIECFTLTQLEESSTPYWG
jgi:hypothetical protein